MFDLFLFFHYYGHQDVCALHVEKIRKVDHRFISLEGAFAKMVLKMAEF